MIANRQPPLPLGYCLHLLASVLAWTLCTSAQANGIALSHDGARQSQATARVTHGMAVRHTRLLERLYTETHLQPLWFTPQGTPNAAGHQLLRQYRQMATLGLHPATVPYHRLLQQLPTRPELQPRHALKLDILFSDLFFTYTYDVLSQRLLEDDLNQGAQTPRMAHDEAFQQRILTALLRAHRQRTLPALVRRLQPASPQYLPLLHAMERYLQLADSGLWTPLPANTWLEPGMQDPRVATLRFMLQQYGDLPRQRFQWGAPPHIPASGHFFDAPLATALKRFQARHGLQPDAKVGRLTLAQLNVPPRWRARQLAHNIRRLYHLPSDLGARHIMVNLADYRLRFVDGAAPAISMKVIIGRTGHHTPIMTQAMNRLVLSPRWNVPRDIAAESILPRAKRDPGFLQTQNISIVDGWSRPARIVPAEQVRWNELDGRNFPFRFMQHPGRNNALGRVKFLLSNDRAIYLHDTPQRQLFERRQRTISAGCIRLEHAMELALRLLAEHPEWPPERIHEVIAARREAYVRLPQSIPVYVMYWTAWQDADGVLQLRPDIYGKDTLPLPMPADFTLSALAHDPS